MVGGLLLITNKMAVLHQIFNIMAVLLLIFNIMEVLLLITNIMEVHLNKNNSQITMVTVITTIINSTSNKMEMAIIINMVETMEPHSLVRNDLLNLYRCPIILMRMNNFLLMTSICDH